MNREEIVAMEAGEELDKEVALALGYEVTYWWEIRGKPAYHYRVPSQYGEIWERLPHYSSDISAAWRVVEKICTWDVRDNMLVLKGQAPDLEPNDEEAKVGWWEAEINGEWGKVVAEGKTAPEAICKVALLARATLQKQEK